MGEWVDEYGRGADTDGGRKRDVVFGRGKGGIGHILYFAVYKRMVGIWL